MRTRSGFAVLPLLVACAPKTAAPARCPDRDDEIAALTQRIDVLVERLAQAEAAPADAAARGHEASAAGQTVEIGVLACDTFRVDYEQCIRTRVPESYRESALSALQRSAEAWKQASKTAEDRAHVAAACVHAREAVAQTCGWAQPSGDDSAAKPVPRVRQADATVEGNLDKDIIRRIVRAHINEVRYCYNQGLVRDPDLEGRVTVNFTISAKGTVSKSAVGKTSVPDENVARCVAKAVKRWKFPKPTGGRAVNVTYPFVLAPG